MRLYNFDLSKHKKIKGELTLQIPPYRERLKMIKDCNFQIDDEGKVKVGMDSVECMINLINITEPFFHKLDLKMGDVHVKSLQEAECYSEFDGIITEAASSILNAGKLGK